MKRADDQKSCRAIVCVFAYARGACTTTGRSIVNIMASVWNPYSHAWRSENAVQIACPGAEQLICPHQVCNSTVKLPLFLRKNISCCSRCHKFTAEDCDHGVDVFIWLFKRRTKMKHIPPHNNRHKSWYYIQNERRRGVKETEINGCPKYLQMHKSQSVQSAFSKDETIVLHWNLLLFKLVLVPMRNLWRSEEY